MQRSPFTVAIYANAYRERLLSDVHHARAMSEFKAETSAPASMPVPTLAIRRPSRVARMLDGAIRSARRLAGVLRPEVKPFAG